MVKQIQHYIYLLQVQMVAKKERTEIILIAEKEKLSFENEKLNNDQFT